MSIVKGSNGLSLNIQHDYITLRTPNGNYTSSWGGSKASGKLASHKTAFTNIDNYVQKMSKQKDSNFGKIMETLLDTKVLTCLWKEWNEEVKTNTFLPEDNVKFNTTSLFFKKYPKGGVVTKVARKNVFIKLADTNEVCGFDYQTLIKQ